MQINDQLAFSADTGKWLTPLDQSLLLVDENFFTAIRHVLDMKLENMGSAILYETGLMCGIEIFKSLQKHNSMVNKDIKRLQDYETIEFLAYCNRILKFGGWGYFKMQGRQKFFLIDLFHSACVGNKGQGLQKNMCSLYEGMWSGLFGQLLNRSLVAVEIQCAAMGNPSCQFILGYGETADTARYLINQGSSSEEILNRMTDQ